MTGDGAGIRGVRETREHVQAVIDGVCLARMKVLAAGWSRSFAMASSAGLESILRSEARLVAVPTSIRGRRFWSVFGERLDLSSDIPM